ncbi:MAG: hypothetical protein ACW98F_07400 [Candidatus Hodarchaeales archaeon]|jgi:hypothetical protein
MPKTITCHQDWQIELIRNITEVAVESYLDALRGKRMFKFIGNQSTYEDIASNIFTVTSGKQIIGKFQIIDDPSGNKLLKIEYEKSGKKAKNLIWNNLFDVLESNLTKPLDQVASGS